EGHRFRGRAVLSREAPPHECPGAGGPLVTWLPASPGEPSRLRWSVSVSGSRSRHAEQAAVPIRGGTARPGRPQRAKPYAPHGDDSGHHLALQTGAVQLLPRRGRQEGLQAVLRGRPGAPGVASAFLLTWLTRGSNRPASRSHEPESLFPSGGLA